MISYGFEMFKVDERERETERERKMLKVGMVHHWVP
jgi:hypothetical protein